MKEEVELWLLNRIVVFAQDMRDAGFTELSPDQVLEYFLKSGRKSNPRKKGKGIEMGWVYKNGPLTLFIWVSFVARKKRFKDNDHLWFVITDERTEDQYYLGLRRTKTLFDRAKPVAFAHKDLLDHWPTMLVGKEEQKQFIFFEPDEIGAKMYKFREAKSQKRTEPKSGIKITELNTPDLSEESKVILALPFLRSRKYCERNILNDTPHIPMAFRMACAKKGIKIPKRIPEGTDRPHQFWPD